MRAGVAWSVPTLLVLAGLVSGCGALSTGQQPAASAGSAASASATTSASGDVPGFKDLFTQVQASAATATSARMVGTGTDGGKQTTFDFRGSRDGSNSEVTVTINGEGTGVLRTVSGTTYVHGDAAYWQAAGVGEHLDLIGNKWVSMPTSSETADLNLDTVLSELVGIKVSVVDDLNTKVEPVTLDGVAAYKLTQRIGGDDTVAWVSADGHANLLKLQGSDKGGPFAVSFSEWNAVPAFSAPAPSEVITT